MADDRKQLIVAGIIVLGVSCLLLAAALTAISLNRAATTTAVEGEARSLSEQGFLIVFVQPDSPAAAADLRRGHIILAVDGVLVNSREELQRWVQAAGPGGSLSLDVLKGNKRETVEITLSGTPPLLGVDGIGPDDALRAIEQPPGPPESRPQGNPPPTIIDVVPDSPAAAAGLQRGDLITDINGQPVQVTNQVLRLFNNMQVGEQVALTVQRNGETINVTFTLVVNPDGSGRPFAGLHLPPTGQPSGSDQ